MGNVIIQAAQFAKRAHEGQFRKYTGRPYLTHLERVAGRAATHPSATEEMVAAGYLHDTKEDTDADISVFSAPIQRLVEEMTNPSKGSKEPRAVRKRQDREHLATVSDRAKVLKLLDRIDNLREMDQAIKDDPKFVKLYLGESLLLLEAIGDVDAELAQELNGVIGTLFMLAQIPVDTFGKPISAGDSVDVQNAGTFVVYEKDGDLWFEPYGKPERVRHYFSNDLIKVEK
jgi:hypothetical protein